MISGEYKRIYEIKKRKIIDNKVEDKSSIKDEKIRKRTKRKKEKKKKNKEGKKVNDNKRIKSTNHSKKTKTIGKEIFTFTTTSSLPEVTKSSSEIKTSPIQSFPATPTTLIPSVDGKKIPIPSKNPSPRQNNPKSPNTSSNNKNNGQVKSNNDNNDNNYKSHSSTITLNSSPTISPSTSIAVSPTRSSNSNNSNNSNKTLNQPAIIGMVFAIVLALIAIVFIIRKTVYNKNYLRRNRHQHLLDEGSWPNYNTYDINNIELMEDNNNIRSNDFENSSMNAITALNRPQRIMSRRFSSFDDITTNVSTSNSLLIDDEIKNDDYSSGIKEHDNNDDNSSLDISIDIAMPPKIVNWEECMR